MKNIILLIICLFVVRSHAQTTLTLTPSQDAAIGYHDGAGTAGNNYGIAAQLAGFAIPASAQAGGLNVNRGLLKFDLSAIPSNATITNATLDLYAYGNIGSYNGHTGSANACYLERVTATWSEVTVTWNNQPATTTTNRVSLPGTTNPTLDYLNINVTSLMQDIFHASSNNGILLKMFAENPTNILAFCSKDHSNPSKHPKLRVTYQLLEVPTAIHDVTGDHLSVNCFPNPAKDELSFNFSATTDPVKIMIYNTLGQTVKVQGFESAGAGQQTTIMNIKDLHSGLYYFSLTSGTGSFSGKFIAE